MHARDRTFAHDAAEQLVGRRRRIACAEREVVLVAAERSIALQLVDDHETARPPRVVGAARHIGGDLRELRVDLAIGHEVRLHAAIRRDPLQRAVLGRIGWGAVEDIDDRIGRLGGDREQHRRGGRHGLVVARRDASDIRAGRARKPRAGRILDRDRLAEPEPHIAARVGLHAAAHSGAQLDRCACIAFEHDAWQRIEGALRAALDLVEPTVALLVGQERDLEGGVALEPPARVVVDRFARA